MKLTYTERNGLLYPDLKLPPQKNYPLGKYGRLRLDFIKQHRRGTYGSLRAQAKQKLFISFQHTSLSPLPQIPQFLHRTCRCSS